MRLRMRWSKKHQLMEADGDRYEHEKQPITTPTHDLCHLVVAAHESMPWKPSGHELIPVAEFNAVQTQRIYMDVYAHLMRARPSIGWILRDWKWHAGWYVVDHSEKHKIHYPLSLEESTSLYLDAVDPELLCRLWPIYIDVYGAETEPNHKPINVSFCHDSEPPTDEKGEEGKALIRLVVESLRKGHAQKTAVVCPSPLPG